jgi:phosphatidylethanolamine/phosphatidyl-N-methylethanolamine N-methyltransferase
VRVIAGDAYDLRSVLREHGIGSIAAVVSSLPLFTKPAASRRELIGQALDLMVPGRPLVQFSYAPVPPVPAEPGRWSVEGSDWILRNIPPARVWTYCRPGAA